MKQIIPFQNELLFKTKVSEITSISLEHTISLVTDDLISGEFHISGDYKMTEGSINREKFDFTLPFDITLDSRYDTSSIVIDIDNFYYEVVNNESLKVNIDVYVEGDKVKEELEEKDEVDVRDESDITEENSRNMKLNTSEEINGDIEKVDQVFEKASEKLDLKDSVIDEVKDKKNNKLPEVQIECEDNLDENIKYKTPNLHYLEEGNELNDAMEFNIFENIDNSDTYVTYHVYIVKENDTIDSIIEKYGVSKDDIALYNSIEDIKPGAKLIIPNINE